MVYFYYIVISHLTSATGSKAIITCNSSINWPTWAGYRVPRQTFMGASYLEAPDPIGWHQKSSALHSYGVIYEVNVG